MDGRMLTYIQVYNLKRCFECNLEGRKSLFGKYYTFITYYTIRDLQYNAFSLGDHHRDRHAVAIVMAITNKHTYY